MARGFCPKCDAYAFGYDPARKEFRCYDTNCGFTVDRREYIKIIPQKDDLEKASQSVLETIINHVKNNVNKELFLGMACMDN